MSATGLGVLASVVFLVRLLPQPIRLVRRGTAAGVSPLSALIGVLTTTAWLVYGLLAALPVVWVVSIVALVPGLWTVALLRGEVRRRDLSLAGLWLAVQVVAALTGRFSVVLAIGVLVTQGPQVLKALREADLSGLAPATWWLSILDAATWGAYGLAVHDPALLGYATVLSASATIVLARIGWLRWSGSPAIAPAVTPAVAVADSAR